MGNFYRKQEKAGKSSGERGDEERAWTINCVKMQPKKMQAAKQTAETGECIECFFHCIRI